MTKPTARVFQKEFEKLLKSYVEKSYQAYLGGEELEEQFLERYLVPREEYEKNSARFPKPVRESQAYYRQTVEEQDWGSVRLFKLLIARYRVYIVRTTTDGDDGWVELYDTKGAALGIGRTYIELVGWGAMDVIRAMVRSGEFPPELADRQERTLWGK